MRVETFTVTSTTRQRGDRSWARAIWSATAADIGGASMIDVSRMLGMKEHLAPVAGRAELRVVDKAEKRLRGPEKSRARGREMLSALGVWPWAHAREGRLEAGWRSDAEFVRPLERWAAAARADLRREADA